ncbi:hypothetical protein P171DRAFT_189674 [Karstenula rhodostoma CBS 690.94]|uniref:Uncharacterized protein n=1 Tax=Karstenula rhodostoma CBS 690.94 TaxID=1392251 RepID=A0A9P4PSB9_9PLEO|nr:hypothetical protein P171DRAFT_189674 [Karstenula rhodostoma CBS 690.94]
MQRSSRALRTASRSPAIHTLRFLIQMSSPMAPYPYSYLFVSTIPKYRSTIILLFACKRGPNNRPLCGINLQLRKKPAYPPLQHSTRDWSSQTEGSIVHAACKKGEPPTPIEGEAGVEEKKTESCPSVADCGGSLVNADRDEYATTGAPKKGKTDRMSNRSKTFGHD